MLNTIREEVRALVANVVDPARLWIGGAAATGGFGLVVFQAYTYLKDGRWPEYNLLWSLEYFDLTPEWVHYPKDWLGLHKMVWWILTNVPLSLVAIILGIAVAVGVKDRSDEFP